MERSGTETENEALHARNRDLAEYWRRQCGEQGARAEKAEKDLQHMLDVGRQDYAEAYAAPIREALDEERRRVEILTDDAARFARERNEEHAARCDLERRWDKRLALTPSVEERANRAETEALHRGDTATRETVRDLRLLLSAEHAQRLHEAELAREAIGHVRALLPPPDDIEIPATVAARAWLDERAKV